MLSRLLPINLTIALTALLAGGAIGTWAGYTQGRAPLHTQIADLRAGHAAQALMAELASARRLQAAQTHSERLSAQLAAQLSENDQLTQEKTHALRIATTGRACLSDRALGLLNESPGITVANAPRVPAPGPAAAAPGATVATDTDIAVWIATAGRAHEQCRARLDALIAWHASPHPDPTAQPAP